MNQKFNLTVPIAIRRGAANLRLPAIGHGTVLFRILRAASRKLRITLRFFTPRITPHKNTSRPPDKIAAAPENSSKNIDVDSLDPGGRWLEL